MSHEQEVDLTKLGSGIHDSVVGLGHMEMPVTGGLQPTEYVQHPHRVENTVIMQYHQERSSSTPPIVDTTRIDHLTGVSYHDNLVNYNTYNSNDYR